jgi:hypothetical protein
MKRRNADMRNHNWLETGEVMTIFGLAYIRSEWAFRGIDFPTFEMSSITRNKGTSEPVARNSMTAN